MRNLSVALVSVVKPIRIGAIISASRVGNSSTRTENFGNDLKFCKNSKSHQSGAVQIISKGRAWGHDLYCGCSDGFTAGDGGIGDRHSHPVCGVRPSSTGGRCCSTGGGGR